MILKKFECFKSYFIEKTVMCIGISESNKNGNRQSSLNTRGNEEEYRP